MFNLNRILNRKGEQGKSPVRTGSTVLTSVEGPDQAFPVESSEQALHAESTEGFLCPSCYLAYPTAEVLQNHYETSHSQDLAGPSLDSRGLLICPCCKMKLGSELELQSHYKRHHSSEQKEREIAELKVKVKALEEEKTLVLDELLGLRLQLPDIFKENSNIKEEKNVLEQKAASLAGELADLKANFDEVNTKKNSLESYLNEVQAKITSLEMEIQQRPEADDVNLLQQELISVQKMMDQLALQREAEKETLQTQCVDLQEKCLRLEKEKNKVEEALLAAPKILELERLQDKISDLTSDISKLHQTIEIKNAEHSKLLLKLEKCANNDKLQQQLLDKNIVLEETLRVVETRDGRINELNSELKDTKETIERMKTERAELFTKIEEGEGANTAILQLKEENSRLQDQVSKQQVMSAHIAHDLEAKVTSRNTELKKIKSQLQTSDTECCELKNKLSDTVKHLSTANIKIQHLESELKNKCQNLSTLETSKNAKLLSLEGMLENTKKDLEEKLHNLEAMKQLLSKKEKEYTLNLKNLEDKKGELEKKILQFQSQLEKMTLQENEMQSKLKEFIDCESTLRSEASQKDLKIEEVELKLAEILDMYKQSEKKESSLKNELQELQETHQNVLSKVDDFQKQVTDYEALKLELSEKLQHITEELQKSQESENELISSLDNMNEVKSQLSAKVLELDNEVKVMTKSVDDLNSEKNIMFADFQETSKLLKEKTEQCKILEQKAEELQENLQNEKDVRIREVQKLQEAKELLISQKVALHKEMDAAKEEKTKEITGLQKTIEDLQISLKNTEEMNKFVNADLEAAVQASKMNKEKWETRQASYEAQIGVLDENLLTLKEDLRSEHLRRETAEQKVDELSGNKLELEAKLENALDERRALLDRCLKSETECEKLQKITADLRRKLDDSVAALQELGRENQTLQMENVKHTTRKWTDDSEVTHCTACGKQFTVTIRKHHCRNCGNIFCNECSLKTTTVASSRKPVRVCDICYSEVSK